MRWMCRLLTEKRLHLSMNLAILSHKMKENKEADSHKLTTGRKVHHNSTVATVRLEVFFSSLAP